MYTCTYLNIGLNSIFSRLFLKITPWNEIGVRKTLRVLEHIVSQSFKWYYNVISRDVLYIYTSLPRRPVFAYETPLKIQLMNAVIWFFYATCNFYNYNLIHQTCIFDLQNIVSKTSFVEWWLKRVFSLFIGHPLFNFAQHT